MSKKTQTVADAFYEEECRKANSDAATSFDAAAVLDRATDVPVTVDVVSVNGEQASLPHHLDHGVVVCPSHTTSWRGRGRTL
jgi:hypothetical protein